MIKENKDIHTSIKAVLKTHNQNMVFSRRVYGFIKKIQHSFILEKCISFITFRTFFNTKNFYIKQTPGKGEGLFASKKFRKGSLLFVATGETYHAHFEGEDCFLYPDWYSVDNDIWIDIRFPYIKINHSCSPNVGIFSSRCFVTLRDIQKDEELTFDYSITDEEPDWIMGPVECNCGEKNCRKFIGPIQTLSQEYVDLSFPYIPKYFLKKYIRK